MVEKYNPELVLAAIMQLKIEAASIHEKIIIDCKIFPDRPRIDLMLLFIPKELRQQGIGAKLMEKLTSIADQFGCAMVLSPENCFGTPLLVLEKFYSSFGFNYQTPQEMVRVGNFTSSMLLDTIYDLPATMPS